MTEPKLPKALIAADVELLRQMVMKNRTCMLMVTAATAAPLCEPLYTAMADDSGQLYFFIGAQQVHKYAGGKLKNAQLVYNSSAQRIHLQISGQCSISMDRRKMRKLWNPVLNGYFPQGMHSCRLLVFTPLRACVWNDCYAAPNVLFDHLPPQQPQAQPLKQAM